jgi:mannose-6-phosphate isomerase-like protein (cupin superfamily)
MAKKTNPIELQYAELKAAYDYLAPDGSEIRLLVDNRTANMCHCVLPAGQTSTAIKHKTIDEVWYFLEGNGEIWRKLNDRERIDKVSAGSSINIPVGTSFQFRNIGSTFLKIVITSIPAWPGASEAIPVEGKWQ